MGAIDDSLKPGALDRVLDLAVAPGFTRFGYVIRSRAFEPLPDATGRTVVITGASTGLGLATARMCAAAGASVVMISRDPGRGEAAAAQVAEVVRPGSGASIRFEPCDMADLDAVRVLAKRLAAELPSVDAVVLNAGVLLHERQLTGDGIELAWATNVIGPAILEDALLPAVTAAGGRIIFVTSGGAYTEALALPDADATDTGDYDGPAVYARTKRAQIALAQLHGERIADSGVSVHAVHPGWADTPGVQSSLPTFRRFTAPLLRSADEGADTIAWLALAEGPAATTGELWHDRRIRPRTRMPGKPDTAAQREKLDARIAELAGLNRHGSARG